MTEEYNSFVLYIARDRVWKCFLGSRMEGCADRGTPCPVLLFYLIQLPLCLTVLLTYTHTEHTHICIYIHILITIYIVSQLRACVYVCTCIYKPLELKNRK